MLNRGGALTKGFIKELDGLRGIAILMVMVHRFWPRTAIGTAADVAGAGWIGVDLFFVISGFLIAGILLDTKGDAGYFRNFYARRALRIFPLFYIFVIGVLVAFSNNPEFRERAGSPLWYLFHLGNIPEGLLDKNVPYWIAPTWSLAIEEQFYLTFPLLVYLLDRRRLTIALFSMIAVAPVIRLVTMLLAPDHERVQYLFTLCRIDTIAVGCLLAVIVRSVDVERWREHAKLGAIVLLPSIVVLAIGSHLDRRSPFDRVFGYSIVAVGCACVVALVILSRGSRATTLLRLRPLTYLGKLCFGLYLLHRPADTIVSAVAARLHIHRDLYLLLPKIGVAIVLATISWRVIERPFLHLKERFATARHPNAATAGVKASPLLPAFVTRALRMIGILLVLLAASCSGNSFQGVIGGDDLPALVDGGVADSIRGDGHSQDTDSDAGDTATDAAIPPAPAGVVLYLEGARHSPIPPATATRLQAIAASASHADHVFAKIGDSITVDRNFLACFDGGSIDYSGRNDLAATVGYFMSGNAAGTSPFARTSLAAKGGTTARDAMTGAPPPLEQELAADNPRIAVVMFGTNEARYDWTVDEFGTHLWNLIDTTIANGVVPIMSTIPANTGYPAANARVPLFNRVIRAIAQGRGVPLVDFHRELDPLPNHGISSDGIHPTSSPDGGCNLASAGLQYGYNVRNLITLEALGRTRAAITGTAADASAATRSGSGTEADPFVGSFPLVDLGDTRNAGSHIDHGCGGASGHGVAYRVSVSATTTLDAYLVDRPGTDVDVRILVGGTCIAAGDGSASATVPAGSVTVLVNAHSASSEGEFLLVVQPR
jgi:peptidoglycan/LPS O-acetylase OafA/YrhL/lysophospholipase L1-like esterase